MKNLFIVIVLAVAVLNVYATDVKSKTSKTTCVSGKVTDKITGEALAGVKIQIAGYNKTVYTDFEGNFKLDFSGEGNQTIKASYISYEENIITNLNVETNSGNNLMMTLTPKQ
jgi:hypothetical protein